MRRWSGILGIAVFIVMGGAPAAVPAAQEGPRPGADIPAPEDCTVEPRPLGYFEDLAGQAIGTPEPPPADDATPADAATVEAVTETIRLSLACANAGDLARYAALHTAAGLLSHFVDAPADALTQLPAVAAAPPAPLPEEQRNALYTVREVATLPDDRVLVLADIYDPSATPSDVTYAFILIETDGQWLIDDIRDAAPETDATPTP